MVRKPRSRSSKDKSLLQLLAAQIGGVYEVLTPGRRQTPTDPAGSAARFDRERLNSGEGMPHAEPTQLG
jgi:hypothetical protein